MNKRTTKWYRKNEEEVIKRLGLKPTRNSGATWIDKADGQNEHFICELKSTDHESFTIKQSVLHTLEAHAIEAHKIPIFAFQFINRDEVWVALKESDIEAYKRFVIDSEQEKETIPPRPDCFGEFDEDWNDECCDCRFYYECEKYSKKYYIKISHKNMVEEAHRNLCNFNENEIVLKKILDKGLDKRYNEGEKGRGGSSRDPMLKNDSIIPSQNNINVKTNKCYIMNKNSINISNKNKINKNKIKENINARNKYRTLKQTEFEENETKRKERNKEWKRNLNKKV